MCILILSLFFYCLNCVYVLIAGHPPVLKKCRNEYSEATFVAGRIARLMSESQGALNYSDFSVLLRTKAQFYSFERIFSERKV